MAVGRCSRRRCCCYSFVFFFPLPSAINAPPPRLFCSSLFMVWRWRYHLRQRGIMEVALQWRINPGSDPSSSSPLCLSAFLFFSSLFLLFCCCISLPPLLCCFLFSKRSSSLLLSSLTGFLIKISVVLHPKTLLTSSACLFVFFFKPKSFPLLFSILYPLSLPSILSSPLSVFRSFSSPFPPKSPLVIFFSGRSLFSLLYSFSCFFFLLCVVVLSFFLLSSSPLPFLLHLSSSIYKQKEREATLPCLVKVQGCTRVVWGGFCTATPTTAGYGFFLPFYMMAGEGVHGCI